MSETPPRRPLVAGETLVDFVPATADPLGDVESFDRRAGGAPANVAVGLSRLDVQPLFWTRIGDDPFGDFLADRLAADGLPDRFVERDTDASTTLAFVSGTPDDPEQPRFTFYRDDTADTRFQEATIPDETLDAVPWVHAGGVALAAEPARSATIDLLERAADAGCTVSFDPNVRPELWGNTAELATVCGWAIESTDVLVATPAELRTLGCAGDDPAALVRDATDLGPHTVVSTLGADGALAVTTDESPWGSTTARHEGYVVEAVDPTGAGDAFTAGLVYALLAGDDTVADPPTATADLPISSLDEALAFANAVAARSTTESGAMAALPDLADVQQFLE